MSKHPVMFLDAAPAPGRTMLAHVGRRRFLYGSAALHAALLVALYYVGIYRVGIDQQRATRGREQRSIEASERWTAEARLEQRVRDMARIKSLLEQSEAADGASSKPQAPVRDDDDVESSARPRTPAKLLKEATRLARAIDDVERDIKAEQLAQLLKISKEKALAKLAETPKQASPPSAGRKDGPDAAARIEQLETRARQALERRRQQLVQRQDGTTVTAAGVQAGGRQGSANARGPNAAGGGGASGASQGSGGKGASGDGKGPAGQGGPGGMGTGGGGAALASVANRMAAFANPDLPDLQTRAYAGPSGQAFFDDGIGSIPAVDARTMVKGSGRMIGPGGQYANRVFVNAWYLIGPFEGRHGEALFSNYRHPPEQGVVLDAVYRGKGGRLLRWEYVDTASYPLMPLAHAEDAVWYGYTELMMDQDRDLTIWVGADDDAQLWLNDRLVWKGGNVDKMWFFGAVYDSENTYVRDYNLTEGRRVVHFRKGRNKLFFRLSNGPTRVFFSLVLTK